MTKFLITKFKDTDASAHTPHNVRAVSLVRLNVLLLVLIAMVAISYLYYMNQTATGGFDIKGVQNRIEQLNKDNKQLEVKAASFQSLAAIETAGTQAGMVATTQIEYIPAVGSSVAVR
ncbi:MAG: hypothetical protein WC544_04230 [Patescibacteria group bacterium]